MIGDGDHTCGPKVLIVEDHELLAQLLVVAFRDGGIREVTVAAPDELHLEAVVALAERLRPDVVLLDLHLGRAGTGTTHIPRLVATGAAVLVMTASDDPVVLGECLELGASGIFSKIEPFETLVEQVRDAAGGDTVISAAARDRLLADLRAHRRTETDARAPFEGLTGRERVVLAGLVRGTTAEQIAVDEHVTLATVRSQIRGVLRKLGVNSQLLAVAMARSADWKGAEPD
jgi:DNA-binding NarL/FixJ family response regulator